MGGASKRGQSRKQIPLLVLANKQDLPSALDAARLERSLGLRELGPKGKAWNLQPTCAVTGEGLEEAMTKLTDMIKPSNGEKSGAKLGPATAVGAGKAAGPSVGGGSNLSSSGSSASTSSSSTTFSSSNDSSTVSAATVSQGSSNGSRFRSATRRLRRSHSHVR